VSPDWNYLLNGGAVEFLFDRRPIDRRRAVIAIKRILNNPAIKIDAFFYDEAGRKISVVYLSGFRIAFWVDHFAKELRVVDVRHG